MVDATALLCPMPVGAVENVTRFAASQGYTVAVTEDGADFKLSLKK